MSSHPPKDKKKFFVWKRHKRDLQMQQQIEAAAREQARIAENAAKMAPRPAEEKSVDPVWSAKTQEIRDKMTGKKRAAGERWNRFAGTEGGGGRGL